MSNDIIKGRIKRQVSGLLNVYPEVDAYVDDIQLKVDGDRLMIRTPKHKLHLCFVTEYLVVTNNGRERILSPLHSNAANMLTTMIMVNVNLLSA